MRIDLDPHVIQSLKTFMLLHIGADNRVTKEELARYLFGKSTENYIRLARQAISEVNLERGNNLLICSDREDGGFFLNGEDEESRARHEKFIAQEEGQALRMLEKVKSMKAKAADLYGVKLQGSLF